MTAPATLPMSKTVQPTQTWSDIPATFANKTHKFPDEIQLAIQSVGSAARIARGWVGISIQQTCLSFGLAHRGAEHSPEAWFDLFPDIPAVAAFRQAQREGWITITKGYAYPNQKLADLICE